MLRFREIKLEDKELFENYITSKGSGVLTSFAYWYAWADQDKFLVAETEQAVFIQMHYSDPPKYIAPFPKDGNMADAMKTLEEHIAEKDEKFEVCGINEYAKQMIEEQLPGKFEFIEKRGMFEYVYSAEALRTLAGKKYHSKRNHIINFLRTYNIEYFPYSDDMYEECMKLVCEWGASQEDDDMIYVERRAIEKMLKNREYLGVKGAVIKIGGEIKAFTAGAMLSNNTVDINFEKCHPDYKGLYPVINQMFLQNAWPDVEFVNREEDMDSEGLRKAKLSYHPLGFEKRYLGVPK